MPSERLKYLAQAEAVSMISLSLQPDGTPLRSCKLCDTFATTIASEMLSHLAGHSSEEVERLKQNPTIWKRVAKE